MGSYMMFTVLSISADEPWLNRQTADIYPRCLVPIRLWCSPWERARDFLKVEQRSHHNVWCTSYRATPHWVTSVMSHFLSRACPLLRIHCWALGYCAMCPYLVKEMNKDTLNEIATCICVMFNGRRAVVLDSNSSLIVFCTFQWGVYQISQILLII